MKIYQIIIVSHLMTKTIIIQLGLWEATDPDDLIEEVTANAGWCIKSIDYRIQLKEDF